MKVAVYSSSLAWNRYLESCFRMCEEVMAPLEVDFFRSGKLFWKAVSRKRYDLILMYGLPQPHISRGRFIQGMERIWRARMGKEESYVWQFGRRTIVLTEPDIYYIHSRNRAVSVHTEGESYRIRTNMKQEEERFSERKFVRIHRNCLVNLTYVKKMEEGCLVMKNGVRLDISIRKRKKVRERLLQFRTGIMEREEAGKNRVDMRKRAAKEREEDRRKKKEE